MGSLVLHILNYHGFGQKQLSAMLQDALTKERETWRPKIYKPGSGLGTDIGPEQRDNIVKWLASLNAQFHFFPDTLVLSVSILDRFLQVIKARPKYLQCIAVSCFYLSAKTLEEDEIIPSTDELVLETRCGCSVSEVLRMERIILDKLMWQLQEVTPLNFLYLFHALLLSSYPEFCSKLSPSAPARQIAVLSEKLQVCLSSHRLLIFPPSCLALALLSLHLELCNRDWLAVTVMLQRIIKLENRQLIRCREVIAHTLSLREAGQQSIRNVSRSTKTAKRKVDVVEVEDIYDSIKRLYGEDNNTSYDSTKVSCGSEACPDNSSLYLSVCTVRAV